MEYIFEYVALSKMYQNLDKSTKQRVLRTKIYQRYSIKKIDFVFIEPLCFLSMFVIGILWHLVYSLFNTYTFYSLIRCI